MQDIAPLDIITETCHVQAITERVNLAPCVSIGAPANKSSWGGFRPGAGRPRKQVPEPIVTRTLIGPRWYCIVTKHGQDTKAADGIRDLGYDAWQMLCHIPARPAKRIDGRMRAAREAHNVPAISGYIFACFDASDLAWRRIVAVHGVERILGQTPERPQALSHGAMMVLQAQCDEDGVLTGSKPATRLAPLAKGALVKIEGEGPFAGLTGLCQWSNKQRVKIVLQALGLTVELARSEVA